jgi:hypothetical protein
MSELGGDVNGGALKTMGLCVLPVLLSMAAPGGISDALSASGRPLAKTPVSPSSAATLPLPDAPAGYATRDLSPGSPRKPNSTPMRAPAPTNHYAGVVEDFSCNAAL